MNIWIINQAAGKPLLGWGERHYYLGSEFAKMGHNVTIFSSSSNHLFFDNVSEKLPKEEYINGVKFCWINTIQYKKSKSIKRVLGWFDFIFKFFWRVIFSNQKRPDKIIVSSSPITPIIPAIIFKKFYKAELIFEIRDIWPLSLQQLGNYSKRSLFIIFLSIIEKMAYKYSDKTVGVMKHGDQHVERISGKNMPYYWIPNGYKDIAVDEITPNAKGIIDDISVLAKEGIIIGYIGTMGIANNMEEVIEIASYLEDCHFVLIGDGPEKENLLKKLDILNVLNVTVFDKVPKEQLNHIVPLFDFGIISWKSLPIYEYGVSANKYFDYMFFGKPIIRLGNVKADPVELYDCGIAINDGDPQTNANAIRNFINEINYDVLSTQAINALINSHTYKVLANSYLKALTE